MHPSLWLLLCLINCIPVLGQPSANVPVDRSRLSIMVLPHNYIKADGWEQIEREPGYKEAISAINSALINMGYTNMLDPRTFLQIISDWGKITRGEVISEKLNNYIQESSADILIEAEIIWTDPPGNSKDRQVRLILRAVDKYNGNVYADNAAIRSAQREFPNLQLAIEILLRSEGQVEFKKFLAQLDSSYSNIIREGRPVNMKFEIARESNLKLGDRIGKDRISDLIESCIQQNAFKGKYQLRGASDYYMELNVRIPVVDEQGRSISPSLYMKKKVDDYLFAQKLNTGVSIVGSWINFMLLKKE